MRRRMVLSLFLLTAITGPAAAQVEHGGIRTETMDRLAGQDNYDLLWNVAGLIGLVGLLGLDRKHDEDSYHPASID